MRVAFAGKGGAGKTTLAATVARLSAREGRRVVAIDADSNPNLGAALGADGDGEGPTALPTDLVSRRLDGPALRQPVDEVLETFATPGPGGVRLLRMGMPAHADEGCMCGPHATVSALLADLGEDESALTVLDLEASPEHFSRGTARHVDTMLLVAEPYYRSLETVRRMAELAAELGLPHVGVVANKTRRPDDLAAIEEFCERHGLALAGSVPWSDEALAADAAGRPLLDHAPEAPSVAAIDRLRLDLWGLAEQAHA